MKPLPMKEREQIRDTLLAAAETLVMKYHYTIKESRRALHELVDVSV